MAFKVVKNLMKTSWDKYYNRKYHNCAVVGNKPLTHHAGAIKSYIRV